jgi:ubiquinone/menaquinone biosynthesis C-methylase UbiE
MGSRARAGGRDPSPPGPGDAAHWRRAYARARAEELSWTEATPTVSLEMIGEAAVSPDAAILDVGGGASRLAAELLRAGYRDVTVLDLAQESLERAKADLGADAARVSWVVGDVRYQDLGRRFDLWHDRATFHFMVAEQDRDAYLRALRRALVSGGDLVLATFGPQGPTRCSGLPVRRYDERALAELLGSDFELRSSRLHPHRTSAGTIQQFLYARFKRRGPRGDVDG